VLVATVCGVLLLLAVGCCCCVWRTRTKPRRRDQTTSLAAAPSHADDDVLPFRVSKEQRLDEEWQSAEKDVDDLPLIDF
jgi:hypothetical protein